MPNIGFTQNSVLSSGSQTYALSSLVNISGGAALAQVLVLRAYDRDKYAGAQTFDYGKFSSPLGGNVSAGTPIANRLEQICLGPHRRCNKYRCHRPV